MKILRVTLKDFQVLPELGFHKDMYLLERSSIGNLISPVIKLLGFAVMRFYPLFDYAGNLRGDRTTKIKGEW